MTLNELRYVVAVARERHFGRAADACYVSQPTLSVAVKKLEDELGVALFERGIGEVSLTPVGARVIDQAQQVLEEAQTIVQIAKQGADPLGGPLRLGAIDTAGPYLLPPLMPLLLERAPRMPLVIEEGATAVLVARLKRADLDLILISLPLDEPGLRTLPLFDEDFVVLLPGAHPWAARNAIATSELADERVLLPGAGRCLRDQVLAVCPDCLGGGGEDLELRRNLDGASLETIRLMVASGVGIGVLPCTAAAPERLADGVVRTRPFADPVPSRRIALAWRKSFPRVEVVKLIAEAIRDVRSPCLRYLDADALDASAGKDS
jgi:LysR family hydrogen peroxide-inducible transcriptional activator